MRERSRLKYHTMPPPVSSASVRLAQDTGPSLLLRDGASAANPRDGANRPAPSGPVARGRRCCVQGTCHRVYQPQLFRILLKKFTDLFSSIKRIRNHLLASKPGRAGRAGRRPCQKMGGLDAHESGEQQ